METHGIKFEHFKKKQIHDPSLSLLDQRLLRVLNDFPFSLSFHDRVSIWHQMIRSDQIERQIVDSPHGRQHVQIRRAYIYEDAFEKLSLENGMYELLKINVHYLVCIRTPWHKH